MLELSVGGVQGTLNPSVVPLAGSPDNDVAYHCIKRPPVGEEQQAFFFLEMIYQLRKKYSVTYSCAAKTLIWRHLVAAAETVCGPSQESILHLSFLISCYV